ncbi:MAG: hypothetical protein A2Z38_08220 [Planctomycetes bacterium RBG_19FT_COMBO_48_8]|nr:MAG: hypothetical protein A2Z38_08220 [Planctomycetes bacterium RBG_19FT_COMBO_48_8]
MDDTKHLQFQVETTHQNRREMLKTGICAGLGLVLSTRSFSCCPCSSNREQAMLDSDDFSMIAFCCLECEKCEVYIATQNNDDELRAKVAKQWNMDAGKLYCDGCKSDRTPFNCDAKKCAVQKNLPTCAHCDDFPSCDKEIWTKWPQLKEKVQTIRNRLST